MKHFLRILLITTIVCLCIGFYIKTTDETTGHFLIGISVVVGFLILMPLFIYHRWKDRSVKDYMLTKENIEKMRDFQKDNKL